MKSSHDRSLNCSGAIINKITALPEGIFQRYQIGYVCDISQRDAKTGSGE